MNCQCITNQRRLTPGVFNLKQYLNSAETMVWRLTDHTTNGGECNLCNYEAFLVLSASGEVDEVLLTKEMEGETMKLTWNVGKYATYLTGYVKYQIVFRSAEIGTLGVIGATDTNANGVYKIQNEAAEGTYRVYTNSNSYRIEWDTTNERWRIVSSTGDVVDYQRFPNPQPCCGSWNTVAVGNNTAAVWASDEAIMYISETIAADQAISANFPTILRQVWEKVRSMIIKAGASTATVPVTETDWKGTEAPYYIDLAALGGDAIPYGAEIMSVILFRGSASAGYSDIANVKIEQSASGRTYIYSPEIVTGKAVILITGGMSYSEAGNGGGDTDTSNLAGDNLPIQLGSPVSIKGYVDAKLGDVNAILDQINGEEV